MDFVCALLTQVVFVCKKANNGNNFSARQVPQHQFLQPQEALLRQDLVSTHLTLQAKDPLLLP